MSLISATELQRSEGIRKEIKKETYKKILEQISKKITAVSQAKGTDTIVTIPPVIIGYPIYDTMIAGNYIERQLKNGGYRVRRLNNTQIYVDWKVRKTGSEHDIKRNSSIDDMDLPSFVNLKKYASRYN